MNFSDAVSVNPHYEVLNPINFFRLADAFLEVLQAELESRQKEQARMEEEMKNLRRGVKSPSSAAVSRDLENLGNKLKESLTEIEKYIQRRSTDRELNKNVQKMLNNTYNMYKVEISRIIIE